MKKTNKKVLAALKSLDTSGTRKSLAQEEVVIPQKQEKSAQDILTLLQNEKERLQKEFLIKNDLHKKLIQQADAMRDQVIGTKGAVQAIEDIIKTMQGV